MTVACYMSSSRDTSTSTSTPPIASRTRSQPKAPTDDDPDLDLHEEFQFTTPTGPGNPANSPTDNTSRDTSLTPLRNPRLLGLSPLGSVPRKLVSPKFRYPSLSQYAADLASMVDVVPPTDDDATLLAEFVLKTQQRPSTTVTADDATVLTAASEWNIANTDHLKSWVESNPDAVLKMLNTLRVERDQGAIFAEDYSINDTDTTSKAEIRKLKLANATLRQSNSNLTDQNDGIATRVEELESELNTLRRQDRGISQGALGGLPASHARLTPKMREMSLFKGKYSNDEKEENKIKYEDWEMAIRDRLNTNYDHYPRDADKVVFMCNTLGGEALDHSRPRRQADSRKPYVTADDVFTHLSGIYAEKDKVGKARREYRSTYQRDTEPFAGFLSTMLRLADVLSYQDDHIRDDVADKMAVRLKDAVILNPHLRHQAPAQEMYDWLQQLDNDQLAEAERKKAAAARKTANTSTATTKTTKETTTTATTPKRDADATRDIERRLGLCHYCHKPGHMAAMCPQKKTDAEKQTKN